MHLSNSVVAFRGSHPMHVGAVPPPPPPPPTLTPESQAQNTTVGSLLTDSNRDIRRLATQLFRALKQRYEQQAAHRS